MTKQLLHPPEPMSFTFHVGCGQRHDYDGKHGIDCPADIAVVRAEPHYGAWRIEEAADNAKQGPYSVGYNPPRQPGAYRRRRSRTEGRQAEE